MNRIEKFEHYIEDLFAEAAMAEGGDFSDPAKDFKLVVDTLECLSVDATLAEAGIFTETACRLRH